MFSLVPWKKKHQVPQTTGALPNDWFGNRLTEIQDEFNSLVDRFWSDWPAIDDRWLQRGYTWGLDVDDQENEYVVRAEAPGFEAEDFDVQVRGNHLVIRAEHKDEQKHGKNGSVYQYGRYERTIPVPVGAETEGITARYHSGVLELHLPKGEEAKGKRIAVVGE